MAFAVPKNLFSRPEDRYAKVSNQTAAYNQQQQQFPPAPWASGHNVFHVTNPKTGTGYIAENRAATGEKAHYR